MSCFGLLFRACFGLYALGDPEPQARGFLLGADAVRGAATDPATGDVLFTIINGSGPRVVVVRGFETGASCFGDVAPEVGDGDVGLPDLLAVLASWGLGCGPEDVNEDGEVDLTDVLLVLESWGACG